MEPNVMCSIDQSNPAVCCCICEFPLPSLCAEHLAKHPIDTNGFLHFHLPLNASQYINTKEIKAQFETWFYKLYKAGKLLKENDDDLKQFEEQIEAMRQEILHEFETDVALTKQKVASLREAFNAQLQIAIRDTNAHAMEQWTPEPGSLASLIWNFGINNQWTLKLFELWTGKQRLGSALQVNIGSSLPSLTQFNQNIDTDKDQFLEQTKLELAESNRRNEELKTEFQKLYQEVRELRMKCVSLSVTIEELKDSTEVHIKLANKEKDRIQFESDAEVKRLRLEVARVTKNSTEKIEQLKEEINESKIVLSDVKSFKEQKEAVFRYQQRSGLLRYQWNQIRNKTVAYKQTAAAGLALSEMLGLHLSRFVEAEKIIDESLQIVTARIPNSEEAMKLWNMKAAIYFHSDRNADCEAACVYALGVFEDVDEYVYWTTLYYLIFSLCAQMKTTEAESALEQWSAKPFRMRYKLTKLLKICIDGRLAQKNGRNKEAEDCFKEAAQMASEEFPTSIYAAMNYLYWGILHDNRIEVGKAKLLEANAIFSVHFPNSFYSAYTLNWLGQVLGNNVQLEEACSKRIEAHNVFFQYHLDNLSTAINLSKLAALFDDMNRLEEAERTYLQACSFYEYYYPTSNTAAKNCKNLAVLYEKMGKTEEAITYATKAFHTWSSNDSKDAEKLALPLLERLMQSRESD